MELDFNSVLFDKKNVLTCSFKLLHKTAQCDDRIGRSGNSTGLLREKLSTDRSLLRAGGEAIQGRLPVTAQWQNRHPAIRYMRPIQIIVTAKGWQGACRCYPWRAMPMFE